MKGIHRNGKTGMGLVARISGEVRSFHIESQETADKIRNYIKNNML